MFFDSATACTYASSAESIEDSAILLAQLQAEGPRGANRELEKKERTEFTKITSQKLSTARLSFTPIDLSQTIIIRIRGGNSLDALGHPVPLGEWKTLESGEYSLREDGHLSLNLGSNSSYLGYGSYGYSGRSTRSRRATTEVEATYTGGFDFTAQDNTETEALKYALGAIISYQASEIAAGIVEIDIDDHLKKRYANNAATPGDATKIPDSLLLPFVKYRPIGV